jgi:hypothetical protein
MPGLAAAQGALQTPVRGAHLGGEAAPGASPGGTEGGVMAACRSEVHHRVPRCLLGFYDRFAAGELDGEGLQAWWKWEEEAFRYGVDPDVSREELEALIEASAFLIPATTHHANHSKEGDFARWGRRGGLRTLALYGRSWFTLLARRRWKKISAEQLAAALKVLCEGQS